MKISSEIFAARVRPAFIFIALLVLFTSCVEQNSITGDPLSEEWQIAACSGAAPEFIGDGATIVGYDGSVIRQGSNGWTCLAANPRNMPEAGWPTPHEAMPLCADEVSMAWVRLMSVEKCRTSQEMAISGWLMETWVKTIPNLLFLMRRTLLRETG